MAQTRKRHTSHEAALRERLGANDPVIEAYIASLKKKYKRYAMPIDEVRRMVDSQMGEKTLKQYLYEARE